MKTPAFLFSAIFATAGICAVCGAGEEIMPLVPGAYSPVEFGDDGTQLRRVSSADADPGEGKRPALRKNIIRLTMPSLGEKTNSESKMRMVEAAPAGPDGTLQFRPLESMPAASMPPTVAGGRGQADIPGLVLPEFLAVSRMERGRIRLPGALAQGTEELSEFDPYSVQRTGDPFRDAPGTAEAFPAAAMQSQAWERPSFANNDSELRPPKTVRNADFVFEQDAGAADPVVTQASSLRPPVAGGASSGVSASLRPAAPAGLRPVASATRQVVPVTVAEITLPPAPASARMVPDMPPLPELPVRSYAGSGQARRAEVVSLPPPLPDRDTRNRGEFSLLSPSPQSALASGLSLALPPTALTEGSDAPFFIPPAQSAPAVRPVAQVQAQPAAVRPPVAEGAFLRPGEKIIDPQTLAPASVPQGQRGRQMVQAPARHGVPVLRADEFTPVRGMRVY